MSENLGFPLGAQRCPISVSQSLWFKETSFPLFLYESMAIFVMSSTWLQRMVGRD